ncbi:hypothetical protein GCM10011583_05190 [Streptomyces camponoticapitis]|uniref:Uncharacterized protein n=1 Tax=Streptomyces camponoticapitis TaxID=1616125 RepID=A0ABQ2DX74_9ACTN|nr:hypothetical protein GCM10011583_05190 [Streptomyces camponoticapitis]
MGESQIIVVIGHGRHSIDSVQDRATADRQPDRLRVLLTAREAASTLSAEPNGPGGTYAYSA